MYFRFDSSISFIGSGKPILLFKIPRIIFTFQISFPFFKFIKILLVN